MPIVRMRLRVQEFVTPGLMLKAWLFSDRRIALNWMSNGDNTVTYRNFRKFDGQSFRNDILSQSWENVYGFSIPNLCAFLALANRSAPLRTKRVRLRSSP